MERKHITVDFIKKENLEKVTLKFEIEESLLLIDVILDFSNRKNLTNKTFVTMNENGWPERYVASSWKTNLNEDESYLNALEEASKNGLNSHIAKYF